MGNKIINNQITYVKTQVNEIIIIKIFNKSITYVQLEKIKIKIKKYCKHITRI